MVLFSTISRAGNKNFFTNFFQNKRQYIPLTFRTCLKVFQPITSFINVKDYEQVLTKQIMDGITYAKFNYNFR